MLIKCPECQKEISDKAPNCPNCGFPLIKPKNEIPLPPKHEDIVKQKNKNDNSSGGIVFSIILCIMVVFVVGKINDYKSNITVLSNTESNYENSEDYESSEEITDFDDQKRKENIEKLTSDIEDEKDSEIITPTFKEYIVDCQEYNYKDVLRNPSDYIGKKVKIEVEISSVHEESLFNAGKYYFAYSKEDKDSNYYHGDMYGIFDNRYNTDLKLLEDDVIMVYGEIVESEYTKSFILSSDELFCIDMKFVELISE